MRCCSQLIGLSDSRCLYDSDRTKIEYILIGDVMKQSKNYVRKLLLGRRNSLKPEEIKEKSRIIIEKLKGLNQFKNAGIILAYMYTRSEVVTGDLINEVIKDGRTACLPLVVEDQKRLDVFRIYNLETDVHAGNYGIYEPEPLPERRVELDELELVIVPGVGFDIRKNRIGYGRGYYDKLMENLRPDIVKIGLAYECQVVSELPVEKTDIKMDIIVTERRIIS